MSLSLAARAIILAFVLFPVLTVEMKATPVEYRLATQDKIRVKVYEWREELGELYEWSALNGDVVVNASGIVSLPLVGEITATGLTTAELSNTISDRLQVKVGLVNRPSAIVEVLEYRPVYVVGSVERPGEYAFRPGMTAMQAVSIAGGLQRPNGQSSWQIGRDVMSARGDLRLLNQSLNRLAAQQARLDAELKGSDSITFPPELLVSKQGPIVDIVRDEQLIFDGRRNTFRQKTDTLNARKVLLQKEIEVLQEQMKVKAKQQASMEAELNSVRSLVKKGLQTNPRQMLLERGAAVFEIGQLELNTSMLRARQEIVRLDESILDLTSQQRNELLAERQQVEASRHDALQKIETAKILIREGEAAGSRPQVEPTFSPQVTSASLVIHRGDKLIANAHVLEAKVEPGDVIEVQPPPMEPSSKATIESNAVLDRNLKAIPAIDQGREILPGF